MTAVTVQRVKTGTGAVITLASFTLFKSEAVAGRRLSQFDIFDGFNYIGSSVSTDDQMRRPICAAMRQMFLAWRTAAQSDHQPDGPGTLRNPGSRRAIRIQDIGDSVSGTLHVRVEERMVRCRNMTSPPHPCHSSRVGAGALQSDDGASGRLEPQDRGGFFSGGEASWGGQMAGRFRWRAGR